MKSYIYIIRPEIEHESSHVYYGSTTNLDARWLEHQTMYDNWLMGSNRPTTASINVFAKYGFDNCKMKILEEFEMIDPDELVIKEHKYILGNPCLNVKQMHNQMTADEERQYIKKAEQKYLPTYVQKTLSPAQIRYSNDESMREKLKETHKKRRADNPHLTQSQNCACGGKYTLININLHLKTQKHLKYTYEQEKLSMIPAPTLFTVL